MRPQIVIKYIGLILILNSVFLLISALISYFNGVDDGFIPLFVSFLLVLMLGGFPQIFVPKAATISTKESYLIIVGAWLVLCLAGTFPYLLYGGEFNVLGAWFESVSGFTTTGSTILNNIEALPKGLLFWRASTHFIGGLGIVVFALVIAPSTTDKSHSNLTNVEFSSLAKDQYRYRTSKIVRILVFVYLGLNILQSILLKIAGMDWFDAVTHSFATIATGGFSTRNMSIAYFDSLSIELIIMFFMVVSGLHFGLIFSTIIGNRNNLFRSEVARYFLISIAVVSALMAIDLVVGGAYNSLWDAIRYGSFQLITLTTSTGFASADSSLWPSFSVLVIILFTIQGGCAGSTSGGIKADRMFLIFKDVARQIKKQQHPRAVVHVKLNGSTQSESAISQATLFGGVFIMALIVGTLINALCGLDVITSFSAAAASLANAGPGFGAVGSMSNYTVLPEVSKATMTFLMLLGRLEIFGLIQFFVISRWR
ncbi:MAG: TrkH family potassium uptake protein [Rikenellaceae bacterium]